MKTAISRNTRVARPIKPARQTARLKNPLQITSILVPVDFSDASKKALAYAAALADQFNARLTLLYILEPVAMPDFEAAFPLMMIDNDALAASSHKKLEQFAAKNSIDPRRIEKILVRHGRPYHEITEAARTLKVDVIVISTHGFSGVARALLGSVTERVVRHAPCPVLVVREQEHDSISI